MNVLNFRFSTAYTQSDLDNLAAAVDTKVGSNYLPSIADNVIYAQTHVRGLSASVDMESFDNTHAGNGTAGGTPMPSNVTFCVSLRTGLTGRSARGRFYAVCPATGDLDTSDTMTSGYASDIVAFLDAVKTLALSAGWTLVVISRQNAGVRLTTAVARAVTTVEATDLAVDSQRRRLLGRGI